MVQPRVRARADGQGEERRRGPPWSAFAPVFGDFFRFISIGAIMSSPVVDRGVVYFGSMDGNRYALQ
jgi:hypothetical protein